MSELGINFIQIIAYVIIFFLLYFFTRKFIKQVLSNLEERKNTIQEGVENAEKAQSLKAEKLIEAEAEKSKILEGAYAEAKDLVEKAKQSVEKIYADANDSKRFFLMQATKEVEELKEKSKAEGLKEANEIITIAIAKAFEGVELDQKTQESFIERSLENLKNKKKEK